MDLDANWISLQKKYLEMKKDLLEISTKIGRPNVEILAIVDSIAAFSEISRGRELNEIDLSGVRNELKYRKVNVEYSFISRINTLFSLE